MSCGWEERLRHVMADPSASFYLRRTLTDALQNRDPVDALNDAEIVVEILKGRWNHIKRRQLGSSFFRPPFPCA